MNHQTHSSEAPLVTAPLRRTNSRATKAGDPLPQDPAEVRSRQILSALQAFSAGDFRARLPLEWAGTDGRIAETFNQTI